MSHSVEVERKFDPRPGFTVTEVDLRDVPGVSRVDDPVVHELEALYLDTADLALWSHRWVLRRRTGGDDAGWHVKRPSGSERSEYRADFRSESAASSLKPPPGVLREVAVHTRGRAVIPIARVSTTRHIRLLYAPDGALVAEVMLDDVVATSIGADGVDSSARQWSEVEIEVYGGPPELLAELSRRVTETGAVPSVHFSKLAAALGDRATLARRVELPDDAEGDPVLGSIAKNVRRLQDHDPGVRRDAPDAIHQMRVAARRLRSVLATYRRLFDESTATSIRDELRWLGAQLGPARDAEVIRADLLAAAEAEPRPLRRGPVSRRIKSELDRRYREAYAVAVATLDDPRYFALLDALDAFVVAPPPGEVVRSTDPAQRREVLAKLTRRTDRQVRRRHEAWVALRDSPAASDAERELALHDVRKSAKRARYAAEAMAPIFGEPAKAYAGQMASLQEVLGDYQDSVVIRHELLLLAESARRAHEDVFTYGRLHALQQARAATAMIAAGPTWTAVAEDEVRVWLLRP